MADVSFLLLEPDVVEAMQESYAFLPVEYVDVVGVPDPNRVYEFCGFPWRKFKADRRAKLLIPTSYSFTSHGAGEAVYKASGLRRECHIAVPFSRNQVRDEKGKTLAAPDPEGMSGGPVWSLVTVRQGESEFPTRRLAGISIRYFRDARLLVGCHISAVLQGIRLFLPEFSDAIPEDPNVLILSRGANSRIGEWK